MNEQNPDEIYYRRLAFKFFDKGKSPQQILQQVPRSRSWLFKWKRRFTESGWAAVDSFAKTPHTSPHQYPTAVRQLVRRMRQRMQHAKVGLVGARALRLELHAKRLVTGLPSVSTIKRWWRADGLLHTPDPAGRKAYYPALHFAEDILFLSAAWVARYLTGGEKVFVFHTLEHRTHALSQTIATNKTTHTACTHLLESFQALGVADFLQIDNDAAFTGLGRKARVFGRFVRLALYFGVELLFIPPAEPKRNSLVERVNGLWVASFFDRDRFRSARDLKRKRRKFLAWYESYAPPSLAGLRVAEARKLSPPRRRLSRTEVESLPAELPLTEGRVHFIRKVNEAGAIDILKESFRVSKSLAGEYVLATIDLRQQRLSIVHRRSHKATAKMIKQYRYGVTEPRAKLQPQYRHRKRRLSVLKII